MIKFPAFQADFNHIMMRMAFILVAPVTADQKMAGDKVTFN
jgi:hypothetical protein